MKNRILFLLTLFVTTTFADEYYAKLEPIETYQIKSATSGKVEYINRDIEGKVSAKDSVIVKLDKKVNEIDLKATLNKLIIINKIIKIEQSNYKKLLKISTKSDLEKDTQKVKVLNLESQKNDLIIRVETLKDTIENKTLVEDSRYISKIYVKEGDYVNAGSALYDSADLKHGKLEFYIPISKAEEILEKELYLDGEKIGKIDKIYKVADSTHISSYKVKIIVENPKTFSKLVKIELK